MSYRLLCIFVVFMTRCAPYRIFGYPEDTNGDDAAIENERPLFIMQNRPSEVSTDDMTLQARDSAITDEDIALEAPPSASSNDVVAEPQAADVSEEISVGRDAVFDSIPKVDVSPDASVDLPRTADAPVDIARETTVDRPLPSGRCNSTADCPIMRCCAIVLMGQLGICGCYIGGVCIPPSGSLCRE